jgi:clan AA aspartic protease (TIGR02281 family)
MLIGMFCLASAAVPISVGAQDDGAIDLFDNQDSMSSTTIAIEGESSGGGLDLGGSAPGGPVTLKFARTDQSLLVETRINGNKAYMIFDTGASLTSISTSYLKSIGLTPPADAPMTTVSTANGMSAARFGMIDNLVLGNRTHTGVTFLTCDACPMGQRDGRPIVGLLGLNVLNRYRYSIDESQGTIVLTPTSAYNNRMRDIEPWIQVIGGRGEPAPKRKSRVIFEVVNRSRRTVDEMIFQVSCSNGDTATLEPMKLPAKKKMTVKQEIDVESCGRANVRALGGRW